MKKAFSLVAAFLIVGLLTVNAQVNPVAQSSPKEKPIVTTMMSKKLANACRKYPQTMGMLLARSTGAETTGDLKWKLLLMDEGDPAICEKLLWDLYEVTNPLFQENLQSIGFDNSEITLSTKLIAYLKVEKLGERTNSETTLSTNSITYLNESQKKKQRERIIAQEDSLFNAWSKNGVPEDVLPNVHATIKCTLDTVAFVDYIDSLNLDNINYSLMIDIDEHGNVKKRPSQDSNTVNSQYLDELFTHLQLSAKPSKYLFPTIWKSINMATTEMINIKTIGKRINVYGGFYLLVKYKKKKQQLEIIENGRLLSEICYKEGLDEAMIMQEILSCLKQSPYNGKLRLELEIINQRKLLLIDQRGFLYPKINLFSNGHDYSCFVLQDLPPKITIKNINKESSW